MISNEEVVSGWEKKRGYVVFKLGFIYKFFSSKLRKRPPISQIILL